MRQIGSLPGEAEAHRLGDYLLVQGIPNQVEPGQDGWAIWVHDDDHREAASTELVRFRENPEDARYREASPVAAALRRVDRAEERRAAEHFIDVRKGWHRRAGGVRRVTTLLVAACVVVAALTKLGREPGDVEELLSFGRLPEDLLSEKGTQRFTGFELILEGQVWRLFTPMFLHFGMLHLIFNLFWLYDLGGAIEIAKGTISFAVLALTTDALSGIAQNIASGPSFGGMSGVNYGLFGYIWMKQKLQPHEGLGLAPGTVFIMIAWLFLCMTGAVGPVGNAAHVAGLVGGMAFGAAPYFWRRARRRAG